MKEQLVNKAVMNIQEYIAILKKEKRFFFTIVVGIWVLSFAWLVSQPVQYSGTLLLNVGRTGSVTTSASEYSYDNFYRLQADERFADTLVRWLANPRIVSDILQGAGTPPELFSENKLESFFGAKRLSSQVVEVRFGAGTREAINRYSESLIKVTQGYTEGLNGSQENWFRVSGSEPVVRDARVGPFPFLVFSLLGALFIGFWAVFLKHFFQSTVKENK